MMPVLKLNIKEAFDGDRDQENQENRCSNTDNRLFFNVISS